MEFVPVIVNGESVPGYFVSRTGKILSTKRNGKHFLAPQSGKTRPYPYVNLMVNGKTRFTMIHRVVCESFIKYPKTYPGITQRDWKKTPNSVKNVLMKNMQVNHKNGNIKDYNLKNLEWTTAEQNINHYYDTRVRCKI